MVALLAVAAVSFVEEARTQLTIARNQHEAARARALAEAGVTLGVLGLLGASPQGGWRLDGGVREFAFGDGRIRVTVQDEAGKVDLNAAPGALLAGLFRTLGLPAEESLERADAVARWRAQRLAEWAAAGEARRIRPFLAVEELSLVPGMTPALVGRALPFVTIHSRNGKVDPLSAPGEVLRSLPGVKQAELEAFIEARRESGPRTAALPALTGVAAYVARSEVEAVAVTAEATTAGGSRHVREAVVSPRRTAAVPFRVLAWR